MCIITNADDLGIDDQINDGVFTLTGEGLLTSVTVLANGKRMAEASRQLVRFPNCSFGGHLNLTEFEPVGSKLGLESNFI